MHFKSLELYGFKSFAGRTKIDFEPGITAIVGPNGCGKSNTVDALKWVLGEQSAKDLRGTNMEDVIFNGTDTKDPVGFAEVSLVLSNESKFLPVEYDEVVITRRLFRSGDSEYLLNKNNVRLKDILELFMGTGVGTSAYSIIEQGKIDMIISSKPEDRRYIFEEASGIIKYKSKKREAVRKLEYTESNILRVTDIIEEVKRQINSIERQARKAERYREEFERLKTLDTKAAFLEYKKLTADKEGTLRGLSDIKMNESALLKEVSALSSRLGELKVKEAEIGSRLSEAQYSQMNLGSDIDRAKDKITLDHERHKELENLKQSLLNEQDSAEKTIADLKEKLAFLTNEAHCITESRSEKETQLSGRKAQLKKLEDDYRQNEQNIKAGKLRIVDVMSAHSKTRNDLTKITSDLSNLQARERRLKIEAEEVNKELGIAQEAFSAIDSQAAELKARIDADKNISAGLKAELKNREDILAQLQKQIDALRTEQLKLESRLSVLKDMMKRYEGFGAGTRAVLVARQENRLNVPGAKTEGIYGAIAELIEVKKGYEAAVEAVLGELLECIVVENRDSALRLINYLRQGNLGRATIVCLDSVGPGQPAASGPAFKDRTLGRLSDYIETQPRFKGLVSALFSDAYLVRDLEGLLHISPDAASCADFVTTGGDLFRNGFFSGGAAQEDTSGGILNRRAHIQETEARLQKIREELSSLETREKALADEARTLLEKIDQKIEVMRQDELTLANKNSQRESAAVSLKKIKDELSIASLELDEVTEDIAAYRTRLTEAESQLKRLDEEHAVAQSAVAASQSFIEKAIKEKEVLLVEITKIETELAGVAEQEKNYISNLNMQQGLFDSQRALLAERQKAHSEASRRQEELTREINTLERAIEENTRAKEAVSTECQEIKNEKFKMDNLLGQAEAGHREKEQELNAIKDRLHHLEMANQETAFKLEALKTRVSQAYKVELEGFGVDIEQDFNPEAAAAEITQLREKIDKMGPVNLVAIEEHQELKERFEFLTKQRDDLINAKESLLEAIRKINKTTRELFMDTFQKVREEFKEYFRYLFGGGQAEIVLMDDQDVLECGIEIMARPPGKKLQSISLLSGGEKALTAIALLFSILKVKPSPFCILDEVDAPLDESNIGRFTKMLSDFTKTSQFIIITHNKKTISMADVMYGITMEHSGVSKVVSVKFAKNAQKAPVAITQGG
jgi:chromosome segregation protein